MTRGMTRDRFAEIKRQLDGAPDYAIAKELVRWIDNEGSLMDFDAPPKPVVIDGPGRYWMKGDYGVEECDVNAGGDQWRATGYRHCRTGQPFDEHGDMIGIPHGEPWRILGRVQYRTRPLTPEEAFKLLGKQVSTWFSRDRWFVHRVGEKDVELTAACSASVTRCPSLETLSKDFVPNGDFALSVREPVPFSEATT